MNAIKKARKLIASDPASPRARTLAQLVRALESEESFRLGDLYQLDYDDFNLALVVLQEWRLDRYYMSKAKLLDIAVHLSELREHLADELPEALRDNTDWRERTEDDLSR